MGADGNIIPGSEQRYLPFGQVRSSQGNITQTDFGYTGQRDLDGTGLMDYKARFYDGSLGRFIQPDTIVSNPINPQTWNRYSYGLNNPSRYKDPDGHRPCDEEKGCEGEWRYTKRTSMSSNPVIRATQKSREHCEGLECLHEQYDSGVTSTSGNVNDTYPPPDEMTGVEKIGMGVTVAMTELFVVLPLEGVLLYATVEVSSACGAGVALACAADIPLVAADIAVADFSVSLLVYAAKSISSGHKGNFEWIIIPAIIDIFKPKE